jgi:hypothetical protein
VWFGRDLLRNQETGGKMKVTGGNIGKIADNVGSYLGAEAKDKTG